MDSVKGKTEKKGCIFTMLWLFYLHSMVNIETFFSFFRWWTLWLGILLIIHLEFLKKIRHQPFPVTPPQIKGMRSLQTVPFPRQSPTPMSRTLTEQGFDKLERLGRGRDGFGEGREKPFFRKVLPSFPNSPPLKSRFNLWWDSFLRRLKKSTTY